MIEMGIVVGIALLITLVKAPWRWKMRMLSNPLLMDIIIFAVLCILHWGTFSGVMVATVGAMTCSLILSAARKLYGYMTGTVYFPGVFDVSSKL